MIGVGRGPRPAARWPGDRGTLFSPSRQAGCRRGCSGWRTRRRPADGCTSTPAPWTPWSSAGSSLLPAGITARRGRVLRPAIRSSWSAPTGRPFGRGLVGYDAAELPAMLGRSTADLAPATPARSSTATTWSSSPLTYAGSRQRPGNRATGQIGRTYPFRMSLQPESVQVEQPTCSPATRTRRCAQVALRAKAAVVALATSRARSRTPRCARWPTRCSASSAELLAANAARRRSGRGERHVDGHDRPAHAHPGADRGDGRRAAPGRRAARPGRRGGARAAPCPTAWRSARCGCRSVSSGSSTRRVRT